MYLVRIFLKHDYNTNSTPDKFNNWTHGCPVHVFYSLIVPKNVFLILNCLNRDPSKTHSLHLFDVSFKSPYHLLGFFLCFVAFLCLFEETGSFDLWNLPYFGLGNYILMVIFNVFTCPSIFCQLVGRYRHLIIVVFVWLVGLIRLHEFYCVASGGTECLVVPYLVVIRSITALR